MGNSLAFSLSSQLLVHTHNPILKKQFKQSKCDRELQLVGVNQYLEGIVEFGTGTGKSSHWSEQALELEHGMQIQQPF